MECGNLIYKEDANIVSHDYFEFYNPPTESKHYYCKLHSKNYEKQRGSKYYKEIEVDRSGEPVGYKKVTK